MSYMYYVRVKGIYVNQNKKFSICLIFLKTINNRLNTHKYRQKTHT